MTIETKLSRRQLITAAAAGAVGWSAHAQDASKAAKAPVIDSKISGDIVIGQSAHLTGPLAPTLQAVLRGQDMAIQEFNRKGGVGGRQVRR